MNKITVLTLFLLSTLANGAYYDGATHPIVLWAGKLGANATSLCSTTIPAYDTLRVTISIAGYAGGETASLQFHGDTGNNYHYRWLTSSAGANTFANGLIAATTDRIKVGAGNTTRPRNAFAIIQNNNVQTEKTVLFPTETFNTGSIGTQSTIDMGNGAWFAGAAATQITSICLVTTGGNNMLSGTGFIIEGINLFQ